MKLAIVGGGAAGLAAAAAARGLQVTLFEKNDRVGKKLAATGNGRCNLSNAGPLEGRYHGDSAFVSDVFARVGREETLAFFHTIGICIENENERLFPASLQAGAVVDQLRFAAAERGAELRCGCTVERAEKSGRGFTVCANGKSEAFDFLLITAGGAAAPQLGGGEDGYGLLAGFGHSRTPLYPAIVQMTAEQHAVRALAGIKLNAQVTLDVGARYSETGEVLFTEYGLSGPPVLQLSSWLRGKTGTVYLNLVPGWKLPALKQELAFRRAQFAERPAGDLLLGLLNRRVGQTAVKAAGVPVSRAAGTIRDAELDAIAQTLRAYPVPVTGTRGWRDAQVTAGGIKPAEFDPRTMESRLCPGLFAAGEVLDVDGDCGGFNLQWAWSSGLLAAQAVSERAKERNGRN